MENFKRKTKELIWQNCIWKALLSEEEVKQMLIQHYEDFFSDQTLDPKEVFLLEINDGKFHVYHFLVHMECMREKLSPSDFDEHKNWVFNNYPQHVPSFKVLLRTAFNVLLRCCIRMV